MDLKPTSGSITPEERTILKDYATSHNIKSVLEFGPGYSTMSFLACEKIVSLEPNKTWYEKYKGIFEPFANVHIYLFNPNETNISVPEADSYSFDLAFVDSPPARGVLPRFNSLMYALARAKVVFLHDTKRQGEQNTIRTIAEMHPTLEIEQYKTSRGMTRFTRQEN